MPATSTPRPGFLVFGFFGNSPTSLHGCDRSFRGGQLTPHNRVQVWAAALYIAQQLRGSASAWWASYIATLPVNHHIPWGEFYTAFYAHNLSAGLLYSKLKEFLDLEQVNHTVFDYTRHFNTLAQYGSYHVDTDEKKANHYREGLTI
jgi:hypothetical protein